MLTQLISCPMMYKRLNYRFVELVTCSLCLSVSVCLCVRMEYDAFRIDAESKNCRPETQQMFHQHKLKFEQLRQVLDIKLQLLDENRVCYVT